MYLSIDWGKKRIGLAVGSIYPKGAGVLDGARPLSENIEKIKDIVAENGVTKLIVGMPMLASGEEAQIGTEIREFANRISDETGLEVVYEPEQFTSTEAALEYQKHNKKPTRASGEIDEMAAILILEQYLESKQ